MSDVIDRPILEQEKTAATRLRIIDCDVHPSIHAHTDLNEFLPKRWQEHLKTYGSHLRTPYIGTTPYPRSSPLIARRDAWPPTGGPPGSDLDFMRKQHLDPLDVEFGILQVLDLFIFSQQNLEFGAAIQRAINDWQLAFWSRSRSAAESLDPGRSGRHRSLRSPRSSAAPKSAATCRSMSRRAPTSRSAAAATGRSTNARRNSACRSASMSAAMAGTRRPAAAGRPIMSRSTSRNAHTVAAQLTSLVLEGIPERFPKLKIVFIEGGFGWIPSATWRMDQHFEKFRDEVPHLKRKPSEYVKEHFWFTTQPIDEPDEAKHLRSLIEWVGVDRLLFSSDYPHWDFDDPRFAFRTPLTETERKKIFNGNARAVYKF